MSTPSIPPYPVAAPTGRLSWALGFLAYIPIPFFSLLIAAVAILVTARTRRRSADQLVRGNATNAANWALTILVVIGLCAVYFAVMVSIEEFRTAGFFPIGAVIIVFFVLAIAHLIVTVAGTIAATTRVFRAPIAIPFLRD
jgi:uncharacterized Tic20 family protein